MMQKSAKVKNTSAYDLTCTVYVPLCSNNNNNNNKNIPANITINPLMYCSDTAYWCSIDLKNSSHNNQMIQHNPHHVAQIIEEMLKLSHTRFTGRIIE